MRTVHDPKAHASLELTFYGDFDVILIFMLIGVGVSCRILYKVVGDFHVSFISYITSVRDERAIFLPSSIEITWFVFEGFLFLLVRRLGCNTLLWQSPGLHYYHSVTSSFDDDSIKYDQAGMETSLSLYKSMRYFQTLKGR